MRGWLFYSASAAAIVFGLTGLSPAQAADKMLGLGGASFLQPHSRTGLGHHAAGLWQMAQTDTSANAPAAAADTADTASAADDTSDADDESLVEQRAVDALMQMGDDLDALHEFSLTMHATLEQVMDSGQKIEFGGTALYRVRRPDHLRMDINTDTGGNEIYYDGKTITVFTPRKAFYGTADAKATIRETIQWMEDTYGIETPLADLWDWGSDNAPIDELEIAFPVGTARVNNVLCGHYAFRTEEADWEVWIEMGDRHLPLKFAITDRTQDALPRFEAELNWSPLEKFDDKIFAFDPPSDAQKIPLTPLAVWAKEAKQE